MKNCADYFLTTPQIPALNGIRAFAVFLVVFCHAGMPFLPAGLGVTLFFVLSGFLITLLLIREQREHQGINVKAFYVRRTLRIFPAYFAFVAASFIADRLTGTYWSDGQLFSALTYTHNYYNAINDHPSISTAHAWSLSIEEQFYLIWPFLFLALSNKDRSPTRFIAWTVLVIMGWRSFSFLYIFNTPSWAYNAFDSRADSLLIGCAFAYLVTNNNPLTSYLVSKTAWWHPFIIIVMAYYSNDEKLWHYTLGFTFESVLCGIFIFQMIALIRTHPWKWLEYRWVCWLGLISYPMYLYHILATRIAHKLVDGHIETLVLVVLLTIVLAACSYYILEIPFLRLKKRFELGGEHVQLPRIRPKHHAQ